MTELSFDADSLSELQMNDEVWIGNVLHNVRQFSRGGMGFVVFLRRDKKEQPHHILGPAVAIKSVLSEDEDPTIRDLFKRELTVWAGLHHANIIHLKEILATRSSGWVAAMDWCDGSLRNFLDNHASLSMEEALFIVRDLVSGLHFAFKEHGILHLDVKPQNILFRGGDVGRWLKYKNDHVRQYSWVVSDWGLASIKNARLATLPPLGNGVATINNLGTPLYMAPERFIRGVTSSVASDLFAVGLVLYEMLIKELPYQRSNSDVVEQIRSHSYFDVAKKTMNQQRIPKPISDTILSLLAPDPELRCSSYTEVIHRLNQFQRPRSIISRIFKSN